LANHSQTIHVILAIKVHLMSSYKMASGPWLDQASSWSSIISAVIALLAVAVGVWASGTIYQTYAFLNRRRKHIGPVARKTRICRSRYHFIRTCRQLLSYRVRSGQAQVRDELTWLSDLNQACLKEDGLNESIVRIPFTFAIREDDYVSTLTQLAAAYGRYASSVRRRWLLRSAAGPLVTQEHDCALATASLLSRWASFEPLRESKNPLRGMTVELGHKDRLSNTRLIAWPDMKAPRVIAGFPVIGISYQPYRVVMKDSPARNIHTEPKDVRVVPQAPGITMSNPLVFDGVLPRWHGHGYRVEIDRITGRQKLHLCVSETSYFAFRSTQDPATVKTVGDAALCSRLLSLNLLALDIDDYIVLIHRSDYVAYPGQYSGTVSGNCELAPREGLRIDVDKDGLPDLLAALIREAREELGLDLTVAEAQLTALGIIEYTGESEIATHALVATTRLPVRARDFRIEKSAPDPIEGFWELGDQFMTINLRAVLENRALGQHFINWLRSSSELSPQASGSLLLLVASRLELQEHQATAKMTKNPHHICQTPWTSGELTEWLKTPLPKRPVRPGRYVRHYPLWK
jgi:8-oxo-dGTP pyrophosphatase MutT (NUDIX family)